jgi:ABC-type siderophore export system fused ATPase/permease subunit
VIAVTHDDAYWGHADRLVKLDGGAVVGDAHAAPASREGSAGNAI